MRHLVIVNSVLIILAVCVVSCATDRLTTYNGSYAAIKKEYSCIVTFSNQDSTFQIQLEGLTNLKGKGKWSLNGDTIYLHCESANSPEQLLEGGVIYDKTLKINVKGGKIYYNNMPLKKI